MSSSEFHFPEDMTGFSKAGKRLIEAGHALGWTIRFEGGNKHIVSMRSPSGEKTVNVPDTNINANRVKSTIRALHRFTDTERFMKYVEEQEWREAQRVVGTVGVPHVEARETAFGVGVIEGSFGGVKHTLRAFEPEDMEFAQGAVADVTRAADRIIQQEVKQQQREERPQVTKTVQVAKAAASRKVISERPWVVRLAPSGDGTGFGYESHSVIHVVYDDGTENYRCRFCRYDNESPRSVSSHAGKAHREHPAPKEPKTFRIEEYVPSGITHSASQVRRLRADLLGALDMIDGWQSLSAEELAEVMAETIYDMKPEREPREPLTDEQVLHRIALLVDGGRTARLHADIDVLTSSLRESQERVQTLLDERRALASMLRDEEVASS